MCQEFRKAIAIEETAEWDSLLFEEDQWRSIFSLTLSILFQCVLLNITLAHSECLVYVK